MGVGGYNVCKFLTNNDEYFYYCTSIQLRVSLPYRSLEFVSTPDTQAFLL